MANEVTALASDPEIAGLLRPNYLRTHQRTERRREIESLDNALRDPSLKKTIANPGRLAQQNQQRKKTLEQQSPPPLTATQRGKIATLNALALASAKEGMVSQEEMRHKPPGASDRHRAYEKAKKGDILLWKRSQILLNPDSDDRDLCNLEKFRPSRPTVDLLANAQLPAVHTMSPQAKENWPLGEAGFTEEERAELEAKGKITKDGYEIRKVRARKLREPKEHKAVECKTPGCNRAGRPFTGPWAKAQYQKHVKQAHGGVEAA